MIFSSIFDRIVKIIFYLRVKALGKLIGKTIAITLASVIGALLIAFGAAALFAPRLVADMFDDMGAYSASIHFYERNFESTKTTDDLVLLIDKIDIKEKIDFNLSSVNVDDFTFEGKDDFKLEENLSEKFKTFNESISDISDITENFTIDANVRKYS